MKKLLISASIAALYATATLAQTASPAAGSEAADEALLADVVVAAHILANEGVLDSFGHVSVRSTRNPNRMFIPRAMPPALVSRKDLVEVDIANNCTAVDPAAPRLNGERFIHCRIYAAKAEVHSVIHAHDLATIPFGIANVALRPVVAQAGFLPAETPLFEIRKSFKPDEAERGVQVTNAKLGDDLAASLGNHPVVLMARHGETVVGRSVREATVRAMYTNINAKAQLAGLQLAPSITPMDGPELAINAKENFDADRPWQNYLSRLPANKR